ncbi:MAG: hypothetical protein Q8R08_03365 [bacterium]|nr:hypothetical protein [bacterium]
MHDTGMPHTHDDDKEENNDQTPAADPKADHDSNHKEKVDGCEFC